MQKSVINYNKLKYFTVVVRCGSISKAAEELYIGQPALSTHIKELEEEIGVLLFLRTKRNLVLTKAGELLYERTAAFFEGEDELIAAVRNAADEAAPVLKIGCMGAEIIHELPGLVHQFSQEYPDIDIKLIRCSEGSIQNALNNGNVDLIILIQFEGSDLWKNPQYKISTIEQGLPVVLISKYHVLAKRDSIAVSELKDCRFGILNKEQAPSQYSDIFRLCRNAGFKPNVAEEYPYIEALLTSINLGNVITMTSSFAPVDKYENIRSIPLRDNPPAQLCTVYYQNTANPCVELFTEFLKESYHQKK